MKSRGGSTEGKVGVLGDIWIFECVHVSVSYVHTQPPGALYLYFLI